MAGDYGDKTEAPTPKRRRESRGRGQVAKSQDLPAAVVVFAGLIGLQTFGPALWHRLLNLTRSSLESRGPITSDMLIPAAGNAAKTMIWGMVPLLVVLFLASLAALYWQVGFLFTLHPVTPTFSKLNPIQGLKRMFSPKTAVSALINLLKLGLMVGVAYATLTSALNVILYSMDMECVSLYVMGSGMLLDLGVRLAAVMLVLALIDYAYQRYRHEKDLRMSKEEVREELKHMEGDPVMKRRRREVQMKLAMQRIQRDVPDADVIVTNPTHFAIALRYRPDEMAAPKVVAKGADWMAYRIRQVAAAAGVPIVERKELARMMYDAVEVGQFVPERFYEAIAEILAYVYELSGQRLQPRPIPVGAAGG